MALSARGQRKDRAEEWVRDALHDHVVGDPAPQPELFSLSRPPCLGEPLRPQEQIQQRTVEQRADFFPVVQMLDIPVPQMVDQPVEVLKRMDTAVVEQVIAVPNRGFPAGQSSTASPVE